MQEIVHMVRNVTLFLVMGNILSNLFNGTKYRKFFTFITGVIVVVMVAVPIFTLLNDENTLESYLEKSILSIDQSDMKAEIRMAGEKMQQRVWEEYENQIADTVRAECGLSAHECMVEVNYYKKGEKEGSIKTIVIYAGKTPAGISVIIKNLSTKLGISEEQIELRVK